MSPNTSPRSHASSRFSRFSKTATAVNSAEPSPQIPQGSDASSTASSSSSDRSAQDEKTSYSPYELKPVPGWPKLGQLMAKTTDFAAFPRFRELNIKSLLYYQVQLTTLQHKLYQQEVVDNEKRGKPEAEYARFADLVLRKLPTPLKQSETDLEPKPADEDPDRNQKEKSSGLAHELDSETEQFKIMKEIREVLKEYNDALLQYSQISLLPDPDPYNIKSLREWIGHEGGGAVGIDGDGSMAWGIPKVDETEPPLWDQFRTLLRTLFFTRGPPIDQDFPDLDLVAMRPPAKLDGLTKWFAWYCVPFYYACKGRFSTFRDKVKKPKRTNVEDGAQPNWGPSLDRKDVTIENVSESSLVRITSGISTVVACLLPVVAIAVLSQVHGTRNLLLCLAGFSVVFCVGLIFMTQGTSKRVEIFSATAAFSAVMVVFMSDPVIVVTPGNPYPAAINITSPGS